MMKPRISLFAEHETEPRRTSIGDPLVGLTKHVDFEALAAPASTAPRHGRRVPKAGARFIRLY